MLKTFSSIMLALLLIGMLASNVQTLEDRVIDKVIYIREDGSIVYVDFYGNEESLPPEGPITTTDNVTYTLTDNIISAGRDPEIMSIIGIVVKRVDIIIDGQGHTLNCSIAGYTGSRGISLTGVSNVTIKNMNIKSFEYGVYLELSSNNTISGNSITNNAFGITFEGHCSYNNITENIIANNAFGISLEPPNSEYNSIIGNNIENNTESGIYLRDSSNNIIHHNTFINNTYQVLIFGEASANVWDNGTYGNYWSDYTGFDNNGDGIGDVPYEINAGNKDRYPIWSIRGPPSISMELVVVIVVVVVVAVVGAAVYIKRRKEKA